jgi:hypothetical protein
MDALQVLDDAFGRIGGIVHRVVAELTPDQLAYRPDPAANSIAWLVWHLARGQDAQVADVAATGQVWLEQGWAERFGLPFDVAETGYGQTAEQVGRVQVPGELLTGYYDAVAAQTTAYLAGLTEKDLDRVVDEAWDPPVTLGVRLVSVVGDDWQHAGQAAYVRGMLERAGA